MKFRFEKTTRLRFFTSEKAFAYAFERGNGFVLADPGAPIAIPSHLPLLMLARGEKCKSWTELERALDWLAEQRAERQAQVIALGGGAALDLSAMAASLYRRGTRLILIPSTLLAMVDATLGGKTAVDRNVGKKLTKNFAGTFYPADEVWIYPGLLSSLPKAERISGAGEVWKTLWLKGKKCNEAALEKFIKDGEVSAGLSSVIRSCLEIKAQFVEKDPLDQKRIRESLNYGHTVGHALESLGEGRISHGEAVLWGMAVESGVLGKAGGKMSRLAVEAAKKCALSLPEEFFLPEEKWLPFLRADKKSKKGMLEVSVLSGPGKIVRRKVTPEKITALVRAFPEFFQP